MYKQFWSFLVVALALFSCFKPAESQVISGVSWVYRGTAQQNNTALTFNLYDTLNLVCKTNGIYVRGFSLFVISKGTIPTSMLLSTAGVLTVTNIGTLIWSDIDGIQSGYENFIIYGTNYNSPSYSYIIYDYRFLNVGSLKTTDSGTYVCSVGVGTVGSATTPMTSGSLTITVNTKAGQARSSRAQVNRYLAYSSAILAASKLIL